MNQRSHAWREGDVGLVAGLAGVDGEDQHIGGDGGVDGRLDPHAVATASAPRSSS